MNEHLRVPNERIYVCPPGAPAWRTLGREPNVPRDGYVLFVGTLEPRRMSARCSTPGTVLLQRGRPVPSMVLAGRAGRGSRLVEESRRAAVGRVRHPKHVASEERERWAQTRVLVLPSLDEGFDCLRSGDVW